MYRSQNQSVGTFTFEITELLCCEFRYRHRHLQPHEGSAAIMKLLLSAKPWFFPVAGISVLRGHHWAKAAPPFGQ